MIKIDGIYDDKIWNELKQLDDVTQFGFDFRPKSFNFLQSYRFFDMLENFYSEDHLYYLHFRDEKDFVINKIIEDCHQFLGERYDGLITFSRILLEFSGTLDFNIFDSFEMGYFVHYDYELDFKIYNEARFLKGVIFSYSIFEGLHAKGLWNEFLEYYTNVLLPYFKQRKIKSVLKVDWGENIFPSLLDSISFDSINFEINSKVEQGYRQVDLSLVKNGLIAFQKEVT